MDIKIDLHLHSPLSRINGDSIKWENNYDSLKKLKNNNIKIAAFSDHNIFKVDFYQELNNLAKTANILLLPAIEINVVRLNGIIANIIFVFKENLSIEELNEIERISNSIPKRGISLEECNSIFNSFQTIKIPHVGKNDFFSLEDLQKIDFDAIEISNEKHQNFLHVNKSIKSSIVAFSDTHMWNIYPQTRKLITIINNVEKVSFDSLKNELQKNKNYTKRRIDV